MEKENRRKEMFLVKFLGKKRYKMLFSVVFWTSVALTFVSFFVPVSGDVLSNIAFYVLLVSALLSIFVDW